MTENNDQTAKATADCARMTCSAERVEKAKNLHKEWYQKKYGERPSDREESQTYDALFDATWEVWEAFAFYGVPPNAELSRASDEPKS